MKTDGIAIAFITNFVIESNKYNKPIKGNNNKRIHINTYIPKQNLYQRLLADVIGYWL